MSATAIALVFAGPSVAHASTFSNSYSGQDSLTTSTTLQYSMPHSSFNLRIWVTKTNWNSGSTLYSVKFYDGAGRLLWSAADQADRIYYVGTNVTKIVIQRKNLVASAAITHWQKV